MSFTDNIRIVSEGNQIELEQYYDRLRALLLTPEGSLVGNRSFGIDYDLIDLPPAQAVNYLQMELESKLPEFIPEITSRGVEWSSDPTDTSGAIIVTITIAKAEEDEDND